jgi:hypothetical protein
VCSDDEKVCCDDDKVCCVRDQDNTCERRDDTCCRPDCEVTGKNCDVEDCEVATCDDEIESFIHQVLQSQMQYLENMMRERLEHERELLGARANAESRLGRQAVEHAEQIFKLRAEHIAEVHRMKESAWEIERRATAEKHQQAIEHEHERFALMQHITERAQSDRIAVLEGEIRALRHRNSQTETERVAHTPDAEHQSSSNRRTAPVELPLQIQDLNSRVRFAPLPPKPDHVVLYQPRDVVERIEFSTPPISAGQSMWQELECLRHELSRLRVIVEDMLCFAPDFTPAPVPQIPGGECED